VRDHGGIVTRGTSVHSSVSRSELSVGDDGTFRAVSDGEDVSDCQFSFLSGINELASVQSFNGDEGLGNLSEFVGVAEGDSGKGSSTASVVDDFLYDTFGVAGALSVVIGTELGSTLSVFRVRLED